jgi:hypothetical protein
MEKKFESELGKSIVEGNRRKVTKKVAVMAFAIISAAAFFGTAAFSFVTSAQFAPYMTPEALFEHEQSTIDNAGGSVAVSRTMTLMTRAYDIDTGGGAHVDCFKFVYVLNVAIVDTDSVMLTGDAIGDLDLSFTNFVVWTPITPVLTVTATTYLADNTATPLTSDVARSGVTMTVEKSFAEDGITPLAFTHIAVDANAPVDLAGTGCSMTLYIEVMVYLTPDIDGTVAEFPFGDELATPFACEF